MPVKIGSKLFNGSGRVFDGTLASVLRGMAQRDALMIAAALADVTDTSGGTGTGTLAAVGSLTPVAVSGSNAAQKAALEAAYGTVRDGIKEIVAQINVIRAKVPAFSALTDSMGGTAANGTIDAVTVALTGVSTSMAQAVGANAYLAVLAARTAQAAYFVNELMYATGLTPLVDNTIPGSKSFSTTFAALPADTGATATGADAGANAVVGFAEVNAKLTILRASIASMAAKLNAITADANATLPLVAIAAK
ncbi:hypothetical protein EVB27_150 [Rhizobium phage RHph_TM16]|nr:hypothetical protein EVB27_150 [Rhizobium phage RHph_TM16]